MEFRPALQELGRRRWSAVVAIVAAFSALPASGTIYKCRGDNGSPVYQEDPCPKGRELRDFDKDPPTVSVMPLGLAPGTSTVQSLPPKAGERTKKNADKAAKAAQTGNAAERKFLTPGINEGEVLARIGQPDVRTSGGRKIVRWSYLPTPDDPRTLTTLTFEHGRLIEVERKIVK